MVDAKQYKKLLLLRWHLSSRGYAVHTQHRAGKTKTLSMHRLVMGATSSQEVDHRNKNRLDNRRVNLRFSTRTQNAANARCRVDSASQAKGVHKILGSKVNPWMAYIRVKGVRKHLGLFPTKKLAAKAYDTAAKKHFKSFASTNF